MLSRNFLKVHSFLLDPPSKVNLVHRLTLRTSALNVCCIGGHIYNFTSDMVDEDHVNSVERAEIENRGNGTICKHYRANADRQEGEAVEISENCAAGAFQVVQY